MASSKADSSVANSAFSETLLLEARSSSTWATSRTMICWAPSSLVVTATMSPSARSSNAMTVKAPSDTVWYLSKPCATPELLARVRAMLRRKENYLPDLLTVGGLALNRSTYELSWQGKSQSLSGREFQILEMLMERPGFVVTTNQLLSHVWGWDSDVDCSVVWVHISNIRKKLARLGAPAGIRFLRGAGYVLEVAQ